MTPSALAFLWYLEYFLKLRESKGEDIQ